MAELIDFDGLLKDSEATIADITASDIPYLQQVHRRGVPRPARPASCATRTGTAPGSESCLRLSGRVTRTPAAAALPPAAPPAAHTPPLPPHSTATTPVQSLTELQTFYHGQPAAAVDEGAHPAAVSRLLAQKFDTDQLNVIRHMKLDAK